MRERLKALIETLMMTPGPSGHEGPVRRLIRTELEKLGLATTTDRLGNLVATLEGDKARPSVMVIGHMDQLGFLVRKIEASGLIRVERLGGVPERALAAQEVALVAKGGRLIPAIIGNKSHHATLPEEKYRVVPYQDLIVDGGFASAAEVEAAGVTVGTPIIYEPRFVDLANGRIGGTSVDDRVACAIMIELAKALGGEKKRPTVHLVFSVQEEFNLRGVLPAAQTLAPDICVQLDLALATDTPDMAARGDVRLGGGPVMGLYSFHGRGTLNGLLPHPALVRLFEATADRTKIPLQRSVHIGALTETSYVQLVGKGVASIDMGFPARYTHSAREVCDLADVEALTRLMIAAIGAIGADFKLTRDDD
ncbi:MAG: M42 family metallopeptidase [Alphaproteobacteria bacterium]|nr:M42 family metallopeptidase [Alphaproteobacteria bacterium]